MNLHIDEALEFGGGSRYEDRFVELEKQLSRFGFQTRTDMKSYSWALYAIWHRHEEATAR